MDIVNFLREYTDYFIFGILILMSITVLYKSIERYFFYRSIDISTYRNICSLELDLVKGLTPIYTIGSVAPYVGLLGTVIGILVTFYDMGQAGGDIEAGKIMSGLALALKATAAGILVAIPAVMFYNGLAAKVEGIKLAWQAKQ